MSIFEQIPAFARLAELLGLYRMPSWRRRSLQWERDYMRLRERGIPYWYPFAELDIALALEILEADALPPSLSYRYFVRRKKNGKVRRLAEPNDHLKAIQRVLLRFYLDHAQLIHPAAFGYRREHSIADHAWTHAGAATIIVCDIADFFPDTAAWRVEAWFGTRPHHFSGGEPMAPALAHLLTLLTTDRGGLPQGAPTSPALSNVVNYEMDIALARKAKRSGGQYSRYVDDLVFSWPDGAEPASDFEPAVRAVLRTYGYRLNADKGWRVYGRGDEPLITGTVLRRSGRVDVPDPIRQRIRQLEADPAANRSQLDGYRGYRQMVRRR